MGKLHKIRRAYGKLMPKEKRDYDGCWIYGKRRTIRFGYTRSYRNYVRTLYREHVTPVAQDDPLVD